MATSFMMGEAPSAGVEATSEIPELRGGSGKGEDAVEIGAEVATGGGAGHSNSSLE